MQVKREWSTRSLPVLPSLCLSSSTLTQKEVNGPQRITEFCESQNSVHVTILSHLGVDILGPEGQK